MRRVQLCHCNIDSYSRWPVAYPLRSLRAKHVCDALLLLFMQTSVASGLTKSSDDGSNFCAKLTAEFMKRMSCFSTPGHPQACGLVERCVGTIKITVSKLACDHSKQRWRYLPYVLWAYREVPNETTGQAPYHVSS